LIEGGGPTATNPLGFTVFRDVETSEMFSGYAIVNDTMVWKLPTFNDPSEVQNDTINFWNAMAEMAEKQNIKKLIIDISENGGGKIRNAFTAVHLLYPDAAYDDIVLWFTARISDPMLFLGTKILPFFENLTSAMVKRTNIAKVVDLLGKFDDSELSNAYSRVVNLVDISNALAYAVAKGNSECPICLNNGGADDDWVNLNQGYFKLLVETAQGLEDDLSISTIQRLFTAMQRSIDRPTGCNTVEEQCNVYKKLEGGVNTTVSGYQKLSSTYSQADYDFTRKMMKRAPFESYVVYSNAGLVGSAANMFETTIRAISKKYEGKLPRTVGSTSGCIGNREECPMSSFTGQIANSNSFVGSFYAMYGVTSVLEEILGLIPDDVLDSLDGIDKKVVAQYKANMILFSKTLPRPPEMALSLPQYNTKRVYNPLITKETIPVEFFNNPPEEYIALWPEPGTLSFTNQKSLPEIYSRLMAFF